MQNLIQNKYDLQPKEGVGLIRLGMEREEIISLLGAPESQTHFENVDSSQFRDYHFGKGLFVDYIGEPSVCLALELPGEYSALIIDKIDLLHMSWSALLSWLRDNDPNLDESDPSSIRSQLLGIAAAPKFAESHVTESIVVFDDRYYWHTEEEIKAIARKSAAETPSAAEILQQEGLEEFLVFLE